MERFISLAVLVFCFVAASVGAQHSDSEKSIEEDLKAFTDSFYTVGHIQECAEALNKIRALAVEKIYESAESMLEGDLPQGKTSSGIFMVYSITQKDSSFYHEFSVSHSTYLATAFGKGLVGMACERFNLPDPDEIWLSPRQVYHEIIRNSIFSVNEGSAAERICSRIYTVLCRHYPDFRHEENFFGCVRGY